MAHRISSSSGACVALPHVAPCVLDLLGPARPQVHVAVASLIPGILPLRMADVEAHITGTVWEIEVSVGDQVDDGDTVVILESMKMEMPVEAEDAGTVKEIRCEEGQSVSEGDVLVVLE